MTVKTIFKRIQNDAVIIILLGLLFRLVVIPFTLNWDLLANTALTMRFSLNALSEFYQDPIAAYPPLMYLTLKLFLFFVKPFLANHLTTWLALPELARLSYQYLFRILFFLKIPFIMLEIASAILFSKLFSKKYQNTALMAWLFNPITLYLIAGWTNVDIFPVFFIILSLYWYKKDKINHGAFALGLAVSYKLFPIFFAPFLIFGQKTLRKKLFTVIAFLVPMLFSHVLILPVLSTYLRHTITGGYSGQIFFSILPIGPNRALVYGYLFYFLLLFRFLSVKSRGNFELYCFLSLLPVFALSKFSLQWFLWLFPFLILLGIQQKGTRFAILVAFFAYGGIVLLSQASLNIGMLAPIASTFWKLDYPIKTLFGEKQLYTVLNEVHSLYAASILWIAYISHKTKQEQLS